MSSSSVSSEPKRIGRRVFPNLESSQIRVSSQYLHYNNKNGAPPEEPPIDYTIKAKSNDRDYKVVSNVFERAPSTDFSREEQHLSSPPRLPKQKNGNDTTVEEILDELDTVLFEASIPFDELKKKVETFNLSFKPYAPDSDIEQITQTQKYSKEPIRIEPIRVSRKDENGNRMSTSTDDLKVDDKKIDEMFKKTQKEIQRAKSYFTPEYFKKQFEHEGVPIWKRNLLADKKSKETIRKIEHDAWAEFEKYKEKQKNRKERMKRSSSVQLGGRSNK